MYRRFSQIFVPIFLIFTLFSFAFAQNETDTVVPGDVERLTVTAGNASVFLSWDVALDDIGVAGYKIYYGTESVKNDNAKKYADVVDVGDVIEYTLTGLLNDVPYYFAVTAYDAAGNESDFYSPEVGATPSGSLVSASILSEFGDQETAVSSGNSADTGDVGGPETPDASLNIVSAKTIDQKTILVTFHTPISLPADPGELFLIQDNFTLESLKIENVTLDPADPEGKSVLLEIAGLVPSSEYLLSLNSDDPATPGDSILFQSLVVVADIGDDFALAEAPAEPDETFPAAEKTVEIQYFVVENLEAVSDTIIVVTFSEPVILSIDPIENFSIFEKNNPEKALPIIGIHVDDTARIVTLTTGLQSNVDYTLILKSVINTDNKPVKDYGMNLGFSGKGVPDTTPPEDVTGFVAKIAEGLLVKMNWKGSLNTAGDLMEYVLYQSSDAGKTYGALAALPKDALKHEISGLQPGDYYFKLTAKDAVGNESKGKIVSVKLVETGPGVGVLLLISVLSGRMLRRKNL